MSDNGDLIGQDQPKVVAEIVIRVLAHADGTRLPTIAATGPEFDEVASRFMIDKARAYFDDYWRMANAPRVNAAGRNALSLLDRAMKRKLN